MSGSTMYLSQKMVSTNSMYLFLKTNYIDYSWHAVYLGNKSTFVQLKQKKATNELICVQVNLYDWFIITNKLQFAQQDKSSMKFFLKLGVEMS